MSIINNILKLLEEKGRNQKDLCAYLGIGTSTMSTWKKRNSDPPAKYIILICEFLEVSPEYLLTGKERTTSNITQSTIGAIGSHSTGTVNVQSKEFLTNGSNSSEGDETAQEITRILNKLSLKERSKLLTMIYDFEEECDQKSKK